MTQGSTLNVAGEKKTKIFISHSSKDIEYVRKIVVFFEDINIPEDGIFCSSIPEYGIPGGKKIYEFLREQFENYNLHVVFVLSDNYYESVASMNEMGAAWVLRNEYTTILLPGFNFSQIKGVLDPTEIATKLDDHTDVVYARLGELKDKVISEFNLDTISANKWERKRNAFVRDILSIGKENTENGDYSEIAVKILSNVSNDHSGKLFRVENVIGDVCFSTSSDTIFSSANNKEISKWDAAIIELVNKNCLEPIEGKIGKVYRVTSHGYEVTDLVK